MKHHPVQAALWAATERFIVCTSGRRSGKTEILKRRAARAVCLEANRPDYFIGLAAPTRDQAKSIFWKDMKLLIPEWIWARTPSESDLTIELRNGATLGVLGMDKPYRAEGRPIDGIGLDEYANMKPESWTSHIRPALSTPGRPGWAWFIGVPEGRNHYYRLWKDALRPERKNWGGYHWHSSEILDPEEIEQALEDLDKRTYDQEYGGLFVSTEGRAYYSYLQEVHAAERLEYNPRLPLIFCFDFNNAPGTATVIQEQYYDGPRKDLVAPEFSAGIGEVWIPKHSRTDRVCRRLIEDWGHHQGDVYAYGDATGGAAGSSAVEGSDWDIIERMLEQAFPDRFYMNVQSSNPSPKSRINSFNSRLMSANGRVRFLLDINKCPHLAEDLEGVMELEGTAGEIDKKTDKTLTHCTDGVGYYVHYEYPIHSGVLVSRQV